MAVILFLIPKSDQNKGGGFELIKKEWSDQFLPTELKRVGKINWNIPTESEKEINEVEVKQPENEVDKVASLLAIKGIKITDVSKDQGNLIFYYRGNSDGFWNRQLGMVQVKENILSKQQIESEGKLNSSEIMALVEKNLAAIDDKKIRWVGVSYKKRIAPRTVTTTEDDADLVELKGDWVMDDRRIVSYFGNSIKVTTTRGGKIIKLEVYLIPGTEAKGRVKTIGSRILNDTNTEDVGLVSYEGGKDYELSAESINVENVTLTGAELVYVYDGRRNKLVPYFELTGTSMAMGPVKVEMLTAAVRE